MKKTIISLLLAVTFIISMSVSVFAGDFSNPYIIVRTSVEQGIPK